MSVILFNGEIAQVSTRRDRTIKIVLESATEITSPEELTALFSLKSNTVSVAIKESQFNEADIEAIPEPVMEEGAKKPSERLRGVIYRFWESRGSVGDSESFYRGQIEKIINQYKEKLPPL